MGVLPMLEKIFGTRKPVIGVVHLLPLPGSHNPTPMQKVITRAIRDAVAYKRGGVDGIIIENFGDTPYRERVGPETVAAMTLVVSEVSSHVDIPIGINVLRNDGISAMAIATVTGASFIRVNVLIGAYVTEQGIISGIAPDLLRYKRFLGSDVKIFADVHVKHATPLWAQPIGDAAREIVMRAHPDAIIVTGRRTGDPPPIEHIMEVKSHIGEGTPIIVGSGVDHWNIGDFMRIADGVIVGTSVKDNNVTTNPVDEERVKKLVEEAQKYRE